MNGAKRVFWRAITVVSWSRLVHDIWPCFLQWDADLLYVEHSAIPAACEVITVINHAITSVDVDIATTLKILRPVELFLLEAHAWAMRHQRSLRQLLALEEHWEWEAA